MTETRKHLDQLVRHARLFVNCAKQPADGVDSSGCIVIHDDTHFAQLESALVAAETHIEKGSGAS